MATLLFKSTGPALDQFRSFVRGGVHQCAFFGGDVWILDQGPHAFSVVELNARRFLACCPNLTKAEARARRAVRGVAS